MPNRYKYSHVIPQDTMYQMPSYNATTRTTYPRIERNAKYQAAQALLTKKRIDPEASYQRRSSIVPSSSGKSITDLELINHIKKLQENAIKHLEERLVEEKKFRDKMTELIAKVSKKARESNQIKKEHNTARNNTKKTQLAGDYSKIQSEINEIIVKDIPPRDKIVQMVKKDLKLQESLFKLYTRDIHNHLTLGYTDKAFRKRQEVVKGLAKRMSEYETERLENAKRYLKTIGQQEANAISNQLSFDSRNNVYKSRLQLPKGILPIKLKNESGKRQSLKNIRTKYKQQKDLEKQMNVNNTSGAKKGPNRSNTAPSGAKKGKNRRVSTNSNAIFENGQLSW